MKFQVIAAAVLLAGGSVALAQQEQQEQQQSQEATTAAVPMAQLEGEQPAEDDPSQEVICRTERVTGSLTRRRRTCMTRAEWAGVEAATRDGMNRMGSNASGGVECRQDQFGGC